MPETTGNQMTKHMTDLPVTLPGCEPTLALLIIMMDVKKLEVKLNAFRQEI